MKQEAEIRKRFIMREGFGQSWIEDTDDRDRYLAMIPRREDCIMIVDALNAYCCPPPRNRGYKVMRLSNTNRSGPVAGSAGGAGSANGGTL